MNAVVKCFLCVVGVTVLLGATNPDKIRKMVADTWQVKMADCTVVGVPSQSGTVVHISVECINSKHPRIVTGFALAQKGYSFCGINGSVSKVNKGVHGKFDVLVGNCTK